ncbi:PAS domain S-box protein [bacterium]|nr:PAS domain S-box protein [bacterium]
MKISSLLPPRSRLLLGGLLLLALLVSTFVYIEVTQTREELISNVRDEALLLTETLNRSSEITLIAGNELDNALLQRLRISARLIDEMQRHGTPGTRELQREAEDLGLAAILLFDANGSIAASNRPLKSATRSEANARRESADLLAPVLDGSYAWTADDNSYLPWTGDTLFAFTHERTGGGAILLGLSSDKLLQLRKKLGIGKLVQDIGATSGIAYVLLQDAYGIITASKGIQEMRAIDEDRFLGHALQSDSAFTRIRDYNGSKVFEIVRRLSIDLDNPMISRIGLSLDRVRDIQQRSMRRTVFIAVGFFVTAAILLVLLLTRKRFALLSEAHRRITTYTGLVLDNIADAVIAIDADQRVTVFNSAAVQLFGIETETAEGSRYETLFPADTLLLAETLQGNLAIPFREIQFADSNGDQRFLVVSTSIIRSDAGATETLVSIARDNTEQRRAQEQLQRRDRLTAMGELAAGIAHEIRNPLNAISIIAQRFQAEFRPADDVEEFEQLTRTVRSEVQRVNGIITQFLEFARPTKLSLSLVPASELFDNSINVVRSQAMARDIRINAYVDDGLALQCDREKMQQVLLNLLQNAIDAMEDGGEIKCVACRKNGCVSLSIADTGPGISEKQQSQIFDLYYTTKSTGTGLGLSIVHHLIAEHDGEISVVSGEGEGTTFYITLPAGE